MMPSSSSPNSGFVLTASTVHPCRWQTQCWFSREHPSPHLALSLTRHKQDLDDVGKDSYHHVSPATATARENPESLDG